MVLYVREGYNEYALEMAEQLHGRFPENFLLHLNRAQILERMDRSEEAVDVLTDVVRKAETRAPNYEKLALHQIRYPLASRLLELGRRDAALSEFRAAIASAATPDDERALSHLRVGEILDARGERDEALRHFREVQKLEDVDDSHRTAKRYLRKQ